MRDVLIILVNEKILQIVGCVILGWYKKHGGQDRDGSRCNEGDRYVHAPCLAYTHTFHHTSPILSLMTVSILQ